MDGKIINFGKITKFYKAFKNFSLDSKLRCYHIYANNQSLCSMKQKRKVNQLV